MWAGIRDTFIDLWAWIVEQFYAILDVFWGWLIALFPAFEGLEIPAGAITAWKMGNYLLPLDEGFVMLLALVTWKITVSVFNLSVRIVRGA
jgi:hypothetical protein